MFTITAVESIRITHTVDRMWVQRVLTRTHPHRAEELSTLSDTDLAAELAAAARQRPGVTADFEVLLAQAAEYTRTSDFAIGVPGHEFAVHGRPGMGAGMR